MLLAVVVHSLHQQRKNEVRELQRPPISRETEKHSFEEMHVRYPSHIYTVLAGVLQRKALGRAQRTVELMFSRNQLEAHESDGNKMDGAPSLCSAHSWRERGRKRRTESAHARMREFVCGEAGGRHADAWLRRRRATHPCSTAPPTCTSSVIGGGGGPGRQRRRQPRRLSTPVSVGGAVAPVSSPLAQGVFPGGSGGAGLDGGGGFGAGRWRRAWLCVVEGGGAWRWPRVQ